MSWNEFMCKFAFTVRRLMESPPGSPEREEWIRIKRELEQIGATATTIAR